MNFKSILPNRFFWWCAGADIEVLEHCPTEHRRYTTLGAIIFIVACIASFSMFFAVSTVIKDSQNGLKSITDAVVRPSFVQDSVLRDSIKVQPSISQSDLVKSPPLLPGQGLSYSIFYMRIAFALLWGLLILLIDRLMVSTINPWDSSRSKFWKSVPRFILALIIATVISRPIEIQIFWDEIQAQVFQNNSNKYNKASEMRSNSSGLPDIKLIYESSKKLEDSLAVKAKQNDFGEEYTKLSNEKINYESKLKVYNKKIEKYEETKKQYSQGSKNGQYLTKIGGDLVWVDVKPLKDEMDRKINAEIKNKKETGYPQKIDSISKKLVSIENAFTKSRDENKTLLEDADKTLLKSITDFSKFQQEQGKMLSKTQYSFAANLDGLSTLGGSTKYAVWFVFLLFLVLELLPITVKLMTPAGNFDKFVREKEKYDETNFVENLKARNRIFQQNLRKWEAEQLGEPFTPPPVPNPQNVSPYSTPDSERPNLKSPTSKSQKGVRDQKRTQGGDTRRNKVEGDDQTIGSTNKRSRNKQNPESYDDEI